METLERAERFGLAIAGGVGTAAGLTLVLKLLVLLIG